MTQRQNCFTRSVLLPLLLSASCAAQPAARADGVKPNGPADDRQVFDPLFDKATLTFDGRTLTACAVRKPWGPLYTVGDRRLTVHDDQVTELALKDGKPDGTQAWSIKSTDGHHLSWLTATDDVAFFVGYQPGHDQTPAEEDAPPRLRRLDLAGRKWLAPLPLPVEKKDATQRDEVAAAVAAGDRLAVMTRQLEPDESHAQQRATGYRITCFQTRLDGTDKPAWSRAFPSNGTRPEPGVYLLGSTTLDYASSAIRSLNWIGDNALVACGGEKEDLFCLDSDAGGKEKWRVRRLWEYQRGFDGPSVWKHYIAPFADDSRTQDVLRPGTPEFEKAAEEDDKKLAGRRAAFDQEFECAIACGPFVVPPPPAHDPQRQGKPVMFVAVAKGPKAWNWGYLSDCIVYLVDGDGRVEEMVNLPRMVTGQAGILPGTGVVFTCQQGGIVKVEPQHGGISAGMGPGGPDLICDIPWYRQLHADWPEAWLSAAMARDCTAFGPTQAIMAVNGGYVRGSRSHVYEFPLGVVDLKTGTDRPALLSVPFAGNLIAPQASVRGGDQHISTAGPYMLGVTALHLEGDTLEVTLGMERAAVGVMFDIDPKDGKQP